MNKISLKDAKHFNNIFNVKNTRNNIKNTRSLLNDLTKEEKPREYISKDIIINNDLEYLKNNCESKYIENTNIYIQINKRPIKNGKFEYNAIGYYFIKFLNDNNLSTTITK